MTKDATKDGQANWSDSVQADGQEPRIEIRMLSHPDYLCVVRAAVESAAARMGMGERGCAELVIAVDEAMTNIIRHGYHGRVDEPITVRLWPGEREGRRAMTIEIEDHCANADPAKVLARETDVNNPQPGGLGVGLIRRTMDGVTFASKPTGPGLRLTMYKYVEPAKTAGKD